MIYLFVCIGNAMRSQMAEGFFNHYNTDESKKAISAGVQRHGYVIPEVIHTMQDIDIDISHHSSDQITQEMTDMADVIVCFDEGIADQLPKEKTVVKHVDDPYHAMGSLASARDQIKEIVLELL